MTECDRIDHCRFFEEHMADKGPIADIQKNHFCRRDHSACARYRVFAVLGPGEVPGDLFPTDLDRAAKLIHTTARIA